MEKRDYTGIPKILPRKGKRLRAGKVREKRQRMLSAKIKSVCRQRIADETRTRYVKKTGSRNHTTVQKPAKKGRHIQRYYRDILTVTQGNGVTH